MKVAYGAFYAGLVTADDVDFAIWFHASPDLREGHALQAASFRQEDDRAAEQRPRGGTRCVGDHGLVDPASGDTVMSDPKRDMGTAERGDRVSVWGVDDQ